MMFTRRACSTGLVVFALWGLGACGPSSVLGHGDGGPQSGSDAGDPLPDAPVVSTGSDFPADPIIDGGPANAGDLFGGGGGSATGGPCLIEPELGALIPKNWVRMRVRFAPMPGQNLFEIRIHAPHQTHDLVVYTDKTTWTMPKDLWTRLTITDMDDAITISVRGAKLNGSTLSSPPALGSTGTVRIAPAAAGGAIVYWTPSNGSKLKGFKIGEETVHDILTPGQAKSNCVGCHTSTPDGLFAGFTGTNNADPDDDTMSVGLRAVDGTAAEPSFLTSTGKALLGRTMQMAPAFSPAHWKDGDRIALSTWNNIDIIWTDVAASSMTSGWGTIARSGDPGNAATPNFSHDGTKIAYCSTSQPVVSGVQTSGCDLWTVPYNNKAGGTASKLAGASNATYGEFYPAFSPDDKLIAFSRLPAGEDTYNNAKTESFVIPAGGGTAQRLMANDPPACTNQKSPGITNSWPKWSPTVSTSGDTTYYWMTFSSTRAAGGLPQLYVTAVTVDKSGTITTYPSLYLWNQPDVEGNHTPAWDEFQIVVN